MASGENDFSDTVFLQSRRVSQETMPLHSDNSIANYVNSKGLQKDRKIATLLEKLEEEYIDTMPSLRQLRYDDSEMKRIFPQLGLRQAIENVVKLWEDEINCSNTIIELRSNPPTPTLPPRSFLETAEVSSLYSNETLASSIAYEAETPAPLKTLVFLLLGKTGVGKSTWINAFANYISFGLAGFKAAESKPKWLVPLTFSMTDNKRKRTKVEISVERSEDQRNETPEYEGASCTNFPRTYVFRTADVVIKLIDTPGVHDTRSPKQDKLNFERILKHLENYDQIDGICILLNSNDVRLDVVMAYCMKLLLGHLHVNAAKNIVFCFTNSRQSRFKPGDTLTQLEQFFKHFKKKFKVTIPLAEENCFCFDNESVRYLAALQCGVEFDSDDVIDYGKSWSSTIAETGRFLRYMMGLGRHNMWETITVNQARRFIILSRKSVAGIAATIATEIKELDDKKKAVAEFSTKSQRLARALVVPIIKFNMQPSNNSITVCTSEKCVAQEAAKVSMSYYHEVRKYVHRVCCAECHLTDAPENVLGDEKLKSCRIFQLKRVPIPLSLQTFKANITMATKPNRPDDHRCTVCDCSWAEHMSVRYTYFEELEMKVNRDIQEKLAAGHAAEESLPSHQKTVKDKIEMLREKKESLLEKSASLMKFLYSGPALIPYNDCTLEYLDHEIVKEELEIAAGRSDGTRHAALKQTYDDFKQQLELLKPDTGMESKVECPNLADVDKIIRELRNDDIMGSFLNEAYAIEKAEHEKEWAHSEIHVDNLQWIRLVKMFNLPL